MDNTFTVTDIRLYSLTYAQEPVHGEIDSKATVTIQTEYRFQSSHNESKHEYTAILGVRLYGENVPYAVTIEMIGTFLFETPPTDEEERVFTSSTSPQILFPYVRETVSDTLRRAGYPSVYLHPVNFQNATMIQEEE